MIFRTTLWSSRKEYWPCDFIAMILYRVRARRILEIALHEYLFVVWMLVYLVGRSIRVERSHCSWAKYYWLGNVEKRAVLIPVFLSSSGRFNLTFATENDTRETYNTDY